MELYRKCDLFFLHFNTQLARMLGRKGVSCMENSTILSISHEGPSWSWSWSYGTFV